MKKSPPASVKTGLNQVWEKWAPAFQPTQLLLGVTAGLVAGVLVIPIELSFGALIFSGRLSAYTSQGIGFALFGALVIGLVVAFTSSFPAAIASPQDSPAAILAVMAGAIAAQLPATATPASAFYTVVVAIALTSLLTGLGLLALGQFKLGGLVRYIPYQVTGGFLAGTGWLLVQGAFGVMTGTALSFEHLGTLFQGGLLLKWLPGLALALLLLAVLRRYSHFLIVPSLLLAALGLFYVCAGLGHQSVAQLSAQGWLLGPFPAGGLWQPLPLAALSQVHWPTIALQSGSMATVMIVAGVSLLLNASGLELVSQQDIDLNQELRSAGLANCLASLGAGPAGYHILSLSALGHKLGTRSRLAGVVCALLCGLTLWAGGALLSYFPKLVLGGLLLFLGLSFLVEWLYDAWFKLPKADYLVVCLILLAMTTLGVLPAVGLGLGLAVILFVVDYSRIGVVKHTFSGVTHHSRVEHPRLYQRLLHDKGHWLYILELQGFIFFGTAHKLLEQIRQRLNQSDLPRPHFVIMDFRQVDGLDASAVMSFVKLKQLALRQKVTLIFTHLSPRLQRQLAPDVLTAAPEGVWRIFPDLDHGLEWCEAQLIEIFASVGLAGKPVSIRQQLEDCLPRSSRLLSWLEDATAADGPPAEAAAPASRPPSTAALMRYLERMDLQAGDYLVRQGESAPAIYFIDAGLVTVQTEVPGGPPLRLRTLGAGTVVGEVGVYLGLAASASVVATQPSLAYRLSPDSLKRMETEAPAMGTALHKFLAQLLSERLVYATHALEALSE